MSTNVPALVYGPQGVQAPSDAQILAGVQQDMQDAFGGTLNFSTTAGSATNPTPQGQLAASLTAIISASYAEIVYFSNQVNPAFAEGRWQDAIGNIYFIERYPAQGTVVECLCTGDAGVLIPGGAVGTPPLVMAEDEAGNQYVCTNGAEIPTGGSITLPFVNVVPGPTPCPVGTLNIIYQTIPGWDSIINPSDGVLGNDIESRAAFETRRAATVEANSFGPIGAMLGAVSNVSGVLDFYGYSNNTAAPVTVLSVTIPANSIYIAVVGGSETAIAQAILSKLPPGAPMYGNTTVTAYDSNPLYTAPIAYDITFEIPSDLAILFNVVLQTGPTVPANAAILVQNAILSAFAGEDGGTRARIGSLLLASRYYTVITALGTWAQIVSLGLGSNNSPDAVFGCTISGTALTVTGLLSGTIEVDGTISDEFGRIAEGTTIVSGSGTSWVVSKSQTVAAASFTGATGSPTTHLITTSVTGVINPGDLVAGASVQVGTLISSQISGTPGGAGTYITSLASMIATTSPCTSSDVATSATPSSNSLQVQANQEPVTDANLIYVSVN